MKKILIVLVALIAIGVSISAVSAEGFSFSFGSESNSDGGDISIDNNKLKMQGVEFKIPEGFKENESARMLANDTNAFGEDCKESATTFYNNDTTIIVKIFFAKDGKFENVTGENPLNLAGHDGFITEKDGRAIFDYDADGKIVEIDAPDQDTIKSILG
ncbi:MAG: hypothetical protein IJ287_09200 [Methanobrevibacter sp.]|nr:hypothetical protein [Methanobrevibacter sp.]